MKVQLLAILMVVACLVGGTLLMQALAMASEQTIALLAIAVLGKLVLKGVLSVVATRGSHWIS